MKTVSCRALLIWDIVSIVFVIGVEVVERSVLLVDLFDPQQKFLEIAVCLCGLEVIFGIPGFLGRLLHFAYGAAFGDGVSGVQKRSSGYWRDGLMLIFSLSQGYVIDLFVFVVLFIDADLIDFMHGLHQDVLMSFFEETFENGDSLALVIIMPDGFGFFFIFPEENQFLNKQRTKFEPESREPIGQICFWLWQTHRVEYKNYKNYWWTTKL